MSDAHSSLPISRAKHATTSAEFRVFITRAVRSPCLSSSVIVNRRRLPFLSLLLLPLVTQAKDVCTVVMDPQTRTAVLWHGSCAARYTPASTFKLPLAVMGFDAGALKSGTEPTLQYRTEDIDWGDASWREPTNPERWMRRSVVWYSQRIVEAVSHARVVQYAQAFKLGNADLSGDASPFGSAHPAWVDSSLKISPAEQAEFVSRLITGALPASPQAMAQATQLLERHSVSGWTIRGKTGGAFPRDAAGRADMARGLGWYIGWAEKEGRSLAFAYLAQDTSRHDKMPGARARSHILEQWPSLVEQLR